MEHNERMGRDTIFPREEKIQETIQKSKEVYFQAEAMHLLTDWEFLWIQFRYTRKRWWVLQAAMLLLASRLIYAMEADFLRIRSMGVIACLFVVLMIPELWRNRESDSLQVEAACFYSLRQIYAARITLFGLADVALVTVFCFGLGRIGFTLAEVVSQFLLPVTVTACICFSLLCGKINFNETVSLVACLMFGGVWWLLLLNESFYSRIVPSVWAVLFAMALTLLLLAARRTVQNVNQYWEVEFV